MLRDIIAETPYWVSFLFILLTLIGLRATKSRTLFARRLVLLPILFMTLNFTWLGERLQGHYFLLFFWVAGLGVGSFFGWISVRSWIVQANRKKGQISVPGSWSTLILIFSIFALRYFFIYNYEMYPESAPHLFISDSLISGTITGLVSGRSLHLYWKYKNL